MGERQNWIDWMKAISMFLIVWGHMFPKIMTNFIYAFNVPVFFVISGMLGRGVTDMRKLWKGLALPYLIICLTYLIINSVFLYQNGDMSLINYLRSIVFMLAGFQNCPHGIGAVAMWFIYSLLIIKIVFTLNDWRLLGLISLLCVVGAILCHNHSLSWSVQNVLLALPFYYLGWLLSVNKNKAFKIITFNIKSFAKNNFIAICGLVILLSIILFFISNINGFARMYACDYGYNIGLFFCGGVLGSVIIYLVSLLLDDVYSRWVRIISVGSIVILAYQFIPIKLYGAVILFNGLVPYKNNDILTFIVSLVITCCFVYVIKLVQRFMPVIMGGRKLL